MTSFRNRLVMKNNAKKQREFFEKRKLQQRLKNVGIALPASPSGATASSMDLVTLFVVNQIAAKKDCKDPPKVAVLGSCKGGSKHRRNRSVVLPMSPCSPSHLSLAESQSHYSVQGMTKRKHIIPQGFKCRQQSPVLESAFSNNSVSHYLQPIDDPLSPFSSASSASSGQGTFPLQLSFQQKSQNPAQLPPHCSPPPWDSFRQEWTKFQPFSQTRDMTGASNLYLHQLGTPTAAHVLFENPETDKTEIREHARHKVSFSLSQSEVKECAFDFMLDQSETEQQFEEDVFRGFSNEEYEGEAFYLGTAKSKIYLKDETSVKSSTPQTVPDSECMGVEVSYLIHQNKIRLLLPPRGRICSCHEEKQKIEINVMWVVLQSSELLTIFVFLTGSGHIIAPMKGFDCLPSYSCRGGYLSSDSSNEEECCQPCLSNSASSNIGQACADTPNSNQDSQEKSKQRHSQFRPLTPLKKNKMQEVMQNMPWQEKSCQNNCQQIESSTVPCLSHHTLVVTESCGLCNCKKTSCETQDAGTQTVKIFTAETCDASTQCDSMTKDTGFSTYLPPVDVSVQLPATGRQTDTFVESNTHALSPGNGRGGKPTPWSKKSKDDFLSGRSTINTINNSDRKASPHTHSFLDALSTADNRVKENGEVRGEQENVLLMKGCSNVREEVTSTTKVNRLSKETKTLQEIADILLLLKQFKKEG
ncbi:hypothetical protein Q8A73_022105 [Channa argus]|nr:hypothetical protein Q8A73_022105 [Channa argus]